MDVLQEEGQMVPEAEGLVVKTVSGAGPQIAGSAGAPHVPHIEAEEVSPAEDFARDESPVRTT